MLTSIDRKYIKARAARRANNAGRRAQRYTHAARVRRARVLNDMRARWARADAIGQLSKLPVAIHSDADVLKRRAQRAARPLPSVRRAAWRKLQRRKARALYKARAHKRVTWPACRDKNNAGHARAAPRVSLQFAAIEREIDFKNVARLAGLCPLDVDIFVARRLGYSIAQIGKALYAMGVRRWPNGPALQTHLDILGAVVDRWHSAH